MKNRLIYSDIDIFGGFGMESLIPKNAFVRDYVARKKLTITGIKEDKEWGGYYNLFEDGHNYDIKILWVKPKGVLSLQYHGSPEHPGHHEIWTPISNARIILGETVDSLEIIDRHPGGIILIPAGHIHSLANPFADDSVYVVEVRISSKNENRKKREANITRIYDEYEREDEDRQNDTPKYPDNLLKSIMEAPFNPKS